jgi:hypothetical protein
MQRPERESFRELPAFTQSVEPPKPPPRLPLKDRSIRKFDCFNSMVDDVDAHHNRPIEAEPDPGKQERHNRRKLSPTRHAGPSNYTRKLMKTIRVGMHYSTLENDPPEQTKSQYNDRQQRLRREPIHAVTE